MWLSIRIMDSHPLYTPSRSIVFTKKFLIEIRWHFVKIDPVVDSQVNNLICIEKFSDFPQLGRFTLRTEGKKMILPLYC